MAINPTLMEMHNMDVYLKGILFDLQRIHTVILKEDLAMIAEIDQKARSIQIISNAISVEASRLLAQNSSNQSIN